MSELNREVATFAARFLQGRARAIRFGTTIAVMTVGPLAEMFVKNLEISGIVNRGVLPEPIDIPDHIGNVSEAAFVTGGMFLASSFALRNREINRETVKRVAYGAFAVSAAVQIIGEKYGLSVYGSNQGDIFDAAYGIAYSAAASHGCYTAYASATEIDAEARERLANLTSTEY